MCMTTAPRQGKMGVLGSSSGHMGTFRPVSPLRALVLQINTGMELTLYPPNIAVLYMRNVDVIGEK